MKSIFKKLRRFSAGLLALMMTAGLVFGAPGLAVTSYAAQELEDANLPINGGSSTTAWLWKHHTPHTPNNFGQITTFEIEGITDPSRIGHPTPYVGKNFNAGGLQGTYNQAGFSTLIQVGTGPLTAYNVNAKNGGVFTSSAIGNLEMQVKSYPSNDNKWMIVEYILYNNSATPVTDVYFGSTADVMIANDDYAPLERKANTVVMRNNQVNAGSNGSGSTPNPHRGAVFELVVNNSLLGIHNVYKEDTYAGAGGDFRNYLGY